MEQPDIPAQREADEARQQAVTALREANLAWLNHIISHEDAETAYDHLSLKQDSLWYEVGDRLSQFTSRLLHPFTKRK